MSTSTLFPSISASPSLLSLSDLPLMVSVSQDWVIDSSFWMAGRQAACTLVCSRDCTLL